MLPFYCVFASVAVSDSTHIGSYISKDVVADVFRTLQQVIDVTRFYMYLILHIERCFYTAYNRSSKPLASILHLHRHFTTVAFHLLAMFTMFVDPLYYNGVKRTIFYSGDFKFGARCELNLH